MKTEIQRNVLAVATIFLSFMSFMQWQKIKQLKKGAKSTYDAMKDGSLTYTPQNKKP